MNSKDKLAIKTDNNSSFNMAAFWNSQRDLVINWQVFRFFKQVSWTLYRLFVTLRLQSVLVMTQIEWKRKANCCFDSWSLVLQTWQKIARKLHCFLWNFLSICICFWSSEESIKFSILTFPGGKIITKPTAGSSWINFSYEKLKFVMIIAKSTPWIDPCWWWTS